MMEQIQDDYRHLDFKHPRQITDLKVGMMVQIAEKNKPPTQWIWFEVTERLILQIHNMDGGLKWVRLPNYA